MDTVATQGALVWQGLWQPVWPATVAPTMLNLVDLAIGLVLLELAVLLAWQRRSGGVPAVPAWLPNLVAGLCLMLGMRAALVGAHAVWILLALMASGGAHLVYLADLRRRWPALGRSPWSGRD
jgi:hypothetical protein